MPKQNRNISVHSPIHPTALTLKPLSTYDAGSKAPETWERFFRAAHSLPAGDLLGWQLAAEGESCSLLAFSGPGNGVTDDDLAWIFRETADLSDAPAPSELSLPPQAGLYALQLSPDALRTYRRNLPSSSRRGRADMSVRDFREILRESRAVLRILSGPGEEGGECRNTVLLAFPEELPLRTRAVLSAAFPFARAVKIPGGVPDAIPQDDSFRRIPSDFLEDFLATLFCILIREKAKKRPAPDEDVFDDFMDDDEPDNGDEPPQPEGPAGPDAPSDGKPLDDLDLSVRSYNCLVRAGIRTVEQLQSLPERELQNIRGIGVRQFDEIRTKLAAFLAAPPAVPLQDVDWRARLEGLIGLEEVKTQVRRIEAFAVMKRDMAARGIDAEPPALNMAFLGNPGTAKTTVARILAGILHEAGILSGTEMLEVGRANLVGRYVGHTADKVREVFREARGKLLFIDEAYSLIDSGRSSFGDEAINTIVQEMENRRDETVVVFAGYPREMEEFIARNPGLSSRIPFTIRFPDYSPAELARIACLEAEKKGFSLDAAAVSRVRDICRRAAGRPDFGNGRFCRNLVENAILTFADRMYGSGRRPAAEPSAPAAQQPPAPEFVLSAEDFEEPRAEHEEKPRLPIGFCA